MNLQPLKIPRGYRGDWPVQEYALIDAVESVITEVELARGSNASLAEELEETYATKSYVQLAISNPNVNDIYVSDLSVKVSEQGLIGYSLQVNGAGSLVFANTYELGNGTLTTPSLYFSDNVDAGIFVNYSTSVEDFNIKVASGIIAKFSHNKISGENTLIFGNLQLSSGGDISGIRDLTSFRRLVTTGTGAYRSEFAEIYVSTITLNTLQANNFGKVLDLGVVDANTLVSDTIHGKCAAGSTNLPEANAGYISHLVRGAGDLMQEYLSESTGYLYRRVKIGGAFGTWTKFAKSVGDSSQTFNVATATSDTHAVTKLALDAAVSALQNSKADLGGSSTQRFKVADAIDNDEAVSKKQLNSAISGIPPADLSGKADLAGSSTQTFSVAAATANDHAVRKEQFDAKTGIATDTMAGIVEKATQSELNSGTANVWPDAATLLSGFDNSTANSLDLPSFLGNYGIRWGSATQVSGGEGTLSVTYSKPFPTSTLHATAIYLNPSADSSGENDVWIQLVSADRFGASFYIQSTFAISIPKSISWFAIGR